MHEIGTEPILPKYGASTHCEGGFGAYDGAAHCGVRPAAAESRASTARRRGKATSTSAGAQGRGGLGARLRTVAHATSAAISRLLDDMGGLQLPLT